MKKINIFALKGNILYCKASDEILSLPQSYLVCKEGLVLGVFKDLPPEYQDIAVMDYGENLIIPGFSDLHLHAPQYAFRGMGMDMELLDWLNTYTFPEEVKYADLAYAKRAYSIFGQALAAGATTRACVFATIHVPATLLLMEILSATGIKAMVGKVNMDRNSPHYLQETDAQASLQATVAWLAALKANPKRYANITPILTPRFIPSCTATLLQGLGELQKTTGLPVQSHLSENLAEVEWVKELCPNSLHYGHAYQEFGLFGGSCPTVMAHCVHCSPNEQALLKAQGVFVAHCPGSNMNLFSGVAPIKSYLKQGLKVGLGTDVAGGASASIFEEMSLALQASKLRFALADKTERPLTIAEVFFMATKGGGEFFGKVGSFEPNYEFDAVVLDDSGLPYPQSLTPLQRLERLIYLADERAVADKYVGGNLVSKNLVLGNL